MSKLELAQVNVGPEEDVHVGDVVDTGTTGEHITHPEGSVVQPIHGGEDSVFPPFDFDAFPSHLFWLLISFGILYFFVNKVIMPKVGGILEDRRDRIASDLGEASRLSRETDEVIAAYERELTEARQRAYAIAHERREEIKAEQARQQAETEEALNTRISEAEAEIAARRDAALADVNAIATDAAQAIVQKLTGVAVPSEDASAAVSQAEGSRA
ncbi:F0F1 ATP synthase subunit B [Acuticoccus yangtzensis]|uniref:F0F1 ATP synthase subunit B n=1 Tax=Acuticoccus yangtzensis TaxID=1443441 RepID=UPI0009F7AABB|nr:F0F1 ATP synthase subunit B [Acuticoccus yangtzensis]ORE96109.1 F0F1 ATP synthase subunit B' [Stappia sp. 22II-S9-Z10]